MEQRLVVHRKDGKIFKGVTQDFDPEQEVFHFLPAEGGGVPLRMIVEEMKALFWVKEYLGNRQALATSISPAITNSSEPRYSVDSSSGPARQATNTNKSPTNHTIQRTA